MERINHSNSQFQDFADVLISPREPYNKNTLWICPKDEIIEIKVYDKGWKLLSSTEDKGLSEESENQVKNLVEALNISITDKIKKQLGQYSNNYITLKEKEKVLEGRINELEDKFEKLTKRYAKSLVKLN